MYKIHCLLMSKHVVYKTTTGLYVVNCDIRRQSIKKPNFSNSEPARARSTIAMVALCSGDFKLYSDASSITPCQSVIELDALE